MAVIGQVYEQLCNMIIRPPRFVYETADLGKPCFRFNNRDFIRTDLELVNPRGYTIYCSHYYPADQVGELPCVIYSHGNCGSRLDGLECVRTLLGFCSVFTLDFSGCGLSDGEYISLGYFEKEDLQTVVNYLRTTGNTSRLGLWGRSMGAAASLFYTTMDPSIAGVVLDSCFSSLKELSQELVLKSQFKIPSLMVRLGLRIMRKTIRNKAKFDIFDLEPVKSASKCHIPALFAHAEGDTFIEPHHTKEIYDHYAGDKNLITFQGDHNSIRPQFFYDSVSIFFHNVLLGKDATSTYTPPPNFQDSMFNDDFVNSLSSQNEQDIQAVLQEYYLMNGGSSAFEEILPNSEQDEEDQLQQAIAASLALAEAEGLSGAVEENGASTTTASTSTTEQEEDSKNQPTAKQTPTCPQELTNETSLL